MSEQQKSKDSKANAFTEENKAQNPSGIADKLIKSELPQAPCDEVGKKNNKKPLHEWVKYFIEIFGILGGLAGLIVLILQYIETSKTTKVLSGQLQEMQAARILDERAWVSIQNPQEALMSETNSTLAMRITYLNTGKTPAYIKQVSLSIGISVAPFDTTNWILKTNFMCDFVLPPNCPQFATWHEPKDIDPDGMQLFFKGARVDFFEWNVEYETFNETHTTQSGFILTELPKPGEKFIGIVPMSGGKMN